MRSTLRWFGEPVSLMWVAELVREDLVVPTPVGTACGWCEELLVEGDRGCTMPYIGRHGGGTVAYHVECYTRTMLGSVGHLEKRCSCYVEGGEHDPVGMSKRDAAVLAYGKVMLGNL